MEITTVSDDIDFEILYGLLDSDFEAKKALNKAMKKYADKLAAYIYKKFRGLFQPEEIKDIVQVTFLELYEQGRKGTLPQDKPILALLFYAGSCNAKDAIGLRVRFDNAKKHLQNEIDACVSGTKAGKLWDSLLAENHYEELKLDFLKFIKELKGQQKIIASIVGVHIPTALDYDDIVKEIYDLKGIKVSKVQVSRTWDVIRKKFKEFLEKHALKG